MALSADELRVVRDALAIAIESSWGLPRPARGDGTEPAAAPAVPRGAVVRDCTELAAALDEAAAEADRMRLFRNADLARYRAALPGSASGYAELLHDALATGYAPGQADIAALRVLCDEPADSGVAERRRRLLRRCEALAAAQVPPRRRPEEPAPQVPAAAAATAPAATSAPQSPPVASPGLPRPALRALPGGRARRAARGSEESEPAPDRQPGKPGEQPQRPPRENPPDRQPASPHRPVPTPAEVFPPRRRPARPPEHLLRPHAARTA
ncbi:hypothetical protein DMB38_19170 [Streptomyces sp. WAC 06738]|uniref:hypothetical protein n=1 Tax=Streptomyces sp. WAC 06738 TaxID=2203210 RepID=UPI000F710A5D|nr:hypothetical protein [Streptomyces sp. WAC 06738]AZM47628.1 hypothetical protein DMB38_19170 [Streptomyces sp. WAC 06738]